MVDFLYMRFAHLLFALPFVLLLSVAVTILIVRSRAWARWRSPLSRVGLALLCACAWLSLTRPDDTARASTIPVVDVAHVEEEATAQVMADGVSKALICRAKQGDGGLTLVASVCPDGMSVICETESSALSYWGYRGLTDANKTTVGFLRGVGQVNGSAYSADVRKGALLRCVSANDAGVPFKCQCLY